MKNFILAAVFTFVTIITAGITAHYLELDANGILIGGILFALVRDQLDRIDRP